MGGNGAKVWMRFILWHSVVSSPLLEVAISHSVTFRKILIPECVILPLIWVFGLSQKYMHSENVNIFASHGLWGLIFKNL